MRLSTKVVSALALLCLTLPACDFNRKAPPLTAAEIQEITEGQPEIFLFQQGTLTLEGMEAFYLGQSQQDAMERLGEVCDVIETYDGGWRHNQSVFKGCVIDEDNRIWSLRVGFWPQNENRVSTLEIKDRPLNPRLVRARFAQSAGQLTMDLPRKGLLMMGSPQYRLYASWEGSEAEPVHLIVGLQP